MLTQPEVCYCVWRLLYQDGSLNRLKHEILTNWWMIKNIMLINVHGGSIRAGRSIRAGGSARGEDLTFQSCWVD